MTEAASSVAETLIDDLTIERTVELLGGRATLRRPVRSRLEAHDLLQEGLPGHALKHLVVQRRPYLTC